MTPTPVLSVCRSCAQKLRVPPDRLGQVGRCPTCGRAFPPVGAARRRRWAGRLVAAYGLFVVVALLLLWVVGEGWGPATLLLYCPRWAVLLPALPVGLAAAACRRRALLGVAVAAAVWVGAGMGYQVRVADTGPRPAGGFVVLSWNTNGRILRPTGFRALLAEAAPDVVLLQEWNAAEPEPAFGPGWNVVPAPHGLWAASPHPVRLATDPAPVAFGRPGAAAAFDVAAPGRPARVVNVHLPTPRPGIAAALARFPGGLDELSAVTADQDQASGAARPLAAGPGLFVVAGDFNLPGESRVFRRHWGDLRDAFAEAGVGFGYTKFTRWHGIRIDHILHDPGAACDWCRVGPDLGSDHYPLLARIAPPAR